MSRPPWLAGAPGAWRLALWVQPGASRTEPAGEHDGSLKLRLAARPIEGQANEALVRWVAERLQLPRKAVTLASGASSRRKLLAVDAPLDDAALVARLLDTR